MSSIILKKERLLGFHQQVLLEAGGWVKALIGKRSASWFGYV
jgi:hypothetical protein